MNIFNPDHHTFSVSEISNVISNIFEECFYWINIQGEITNLSVSQNGHIYFALKDENSIINMICWNAKSNEIKKQIIEGNLVVCSGCLKIYNKSSKYQLIVDSIKNTENDTSSMKLEQLKLKQKFEAKGFFNKERKKIINKIPEKIAIITSEKGAVLQDMLHRIKDRFPCKVLLCNIPVQNENTHIKIITILKQIDNKKYDAIIIARGGGSQEDFQPFNKESLIEHINKLKTPIVSAIGHETDNTLLDLIADLRAPTPTAAIEMLLPLRADIENKIHNNFNNIRQIIEQKINFYNLKISTSDIQKNIINYQLIDTQNIIDKKIISIENITWNQINTINHKIETQKLTLEKYNPDKITKMGYAIIKQKNLIITSKKSIKKNEAIQIHFHDGKIFAINKNNKV